MSKGPWLAWTSAQAASAWNRAERDLRQAWYGLLKPLFHLLQDDADLYVFLWGRTWSWLWPMVPVALAGGAALALLGMWSFQVRAGLPAAGPGRLLAEVVATLGMTLGVSPGFSGSSWLVLDHSWPLTRARAWVIRLTGSILHPACLMALLVGSVAAVPWLARPSGGFAILLALLPILAFWTCHGLLVLGKTLRRPRRVRLAASARTEATLRVFFRQMAGRDGGIFGRVGFVLTLPLLFRGDFLLGFSVLGLWWALVQADILRLEGRSASLMASFPVPAEAQVNARILGVAEWSSPSAVIALTAVGLGAGPTALLPGAMALFQMNLTGAALGLLASASVPLDGCSLMSLQSLGMLTLCGGTASGWLARLAFTDPSVVVLQAFAVGLAWILLRRARGRVLGNWARIQENLIRS